MDDNDKKKGIVNEIRGIPVYQSNPSVPKESEIRRIKRSQIGTPNKGIVVDNSSGEILGHGGAMFYEWEEVDAERFVKLYMDGMKRAVGLTKAGISLLEIVYAKVRENPNTDCVPLDSFGIDGRVYRRGVRELLQKEFIFRSTNPGLFFVNIRFMFNGNRLAFIKGYRLKDQKNIAKKI